MSSKHTKAGRRARRRAHQLREAWFGHRCGCSTEKSSATSADRRFDGTRKRPTRGTEHTARLARAAGLLVDAQTWTPRGETT